MSKSYIGWAYATASWKDAYRGLSMNFISVCGACGLEEPMHIKGCSQYGISNSKGGTKHDQEKTRLDLLSSIALEQLGNVLAAGAKKYDAHNWRKGIAFTRIIGAILRHTFAYLKGEDKDPETGLSHIAHAMCGCMFLLEYEQTHKELDDRYKHANNEVKD